MTDLEDDAPGGGCLDTCPAIDHGGGEWLLHEDVLAGGRRLLDEVAVTPVGGGDQDTLYLIVGQQLLERGGGPATVTGGECGPALLTPGETGDDLGHTTPIDRIGQLRAPPAETDTAQSHLVIHARAPFRAIIYVVSYGIDRRLPAPANTPGRDAGDGTR